MWVGEVGVGSEAPSACPTPTRKRKTCPAVPPGTLRSRVSG